MRYKFVHQAALQPGQQVQYHICVKTQMAPDDFKTPCCKCGEMCFHKDLSVAKSIICIQCILKEVENQ